MIFLCAVVPDEGRSWVEQVVENPAIIPDAPAGVSFDDLGRAVFSEAAAREFFFNDCSNEVAARAAKRLVPFAQTVPTEKFPRCSWPKVPAAYILGTFDRAISPAWSRQVALERLDTTPVELPTGHDPFLALPERLAEALVRIATSP